MKIYSKRHPRKNEALDSINNMPAWLLEGVQASLKNNGQSEKEINDARVVYNIPLRDQRTIFYLSVPEGNTPEVAARIAEAMTASWERLTSPEGILFK